MVVEGICQVSRRLHCRAQSTCVWCLCARILYPWIPELYVPSFSNRFINCRFLNISGLGGLQSAFLIGFKQLVPEHTVTLFRSPIKMRVKVPTLLPQNFLTTALPRIISIRSSLVSTLPRNIRIIFTSSSRVPCLMDLSPLLQTQHPRYSPNHIRNTNAINQSPRRCIRNFLVCLLLPRQNSTSNQRCRYNDFQSPRQSRDMSTVEPGRRRTK
jgi:hypothetical protein